MRAHDFLREDDDHEQDIKNQLLTLLTTLHASQVPQVSIKQLQKSLEDEGLYVTTDWILDQVKSIPIVKNSDDSKISLDVEHDTSDKEEAVDDDEEKNRKSVKNMAKNALKKRKK